jgi:hypothetical protein
MMRRSEIRTKINYSKILVVVFITALIWVWADLAQDEILPDRSAVIVVDQAANPKLWVSLDKASSRDIRITLSGPHTAITDFSRKLKEGKRFEFDFDAEQLKMQKPGRYTLNTLAFLQKEKQIRQLGLKIESCQPEAISVDVAQLVKKTLTIRCVDEKANPIRGAAIKPPQVDMFVPEDWSGERLIADVQLAISELEQARFTPVEKIPYVELTPGYKKNATLSVKINAKEHLKLADYIITTVIPKYSISANLQGKYKVEVLNLDAVMSPISINATPEAKWAYENMAYQVRLEIDDNDAKSPGAQRKPVVYNFPDEYVRRDEIRLNQQPVTAQFKLIPLSSSDLASP